MSVHASRLPPDGLGFAGGTDEKKQARVSCALSSTPTSAARGIQLRLSLDKKRTRRTVVKIHPRRFGRRYSSVHKLGGVQNVGANALLFWNLVDEAGVEDMDKTLSWSSSAS